MPSRAEWEYHAERLPDQVDTLNDSLRLLGDAGWELVTSSSASAQVRQGSTQVWQTTHTLFWRRRRRDGGDA
jgi:hypothetical protein